MTQPRPGSLFLPAFIFFVAVISVPVNAQDMGCAYLKAAGRSSPLCPGSGGSRSSGGDSSAQQKIDEINRNNAASQQALKEGFDALKGILTSHPGSETNDLNDTPPDISSAPDSQAEIYRQAAQTYRKMAARAAGATRDCYLAHADFYDSVVDDLQGHGSSLSQPTCSLSGGDSGDETSGSTRFNAGSSGRNYVSDAPYISDVKDKRLPPDPAELEAIAAERAARQRESEAADLLKEARELSQPDCAGLMSTYYTGRAPALPAECMSEAERMSVYTPGAWPRPQLPVSSEPVIDGSNIPSVIDFALGGGAGSGKPDTMMPGFGVSPSLQRLVDEDLPVAPEPSESPAPSQTSSPLVVASSQNDSQAELSAEAPSLKPEESASDAASGGIFDRILDGAKNAPAAWKDFRIRVGYCIRGKGCINPPDGGSATPSPSPTPSSPESDDAELNRAQNPGNILLKGKKYPSDLHDKTNNTIDQILDK
jgi:hypothetical protein